MCIKEIKHIYVQFVIISRFNAFFVSHECFYMHIYTKTEIAASKMVLVTLKIYLQKPLKILHKMVT